MSFSNNLMKLFPHKSVFKFFNSSRSKTFSGFLLFTETSSNENNRNYHIQLSTSIIDKWHAAYLYTRARPVYARTISRNYLDYASTNKTKTKTHFAKQDQYWNYRYWSFFAHHYLVASPLYQNLLYQLLYGNNSNHNLYLLLFAICWHL